MYLDFSVFLCNVYNNNIMLLCRRSENRNLQTTIPPGATDHWQGRRGQQLRPRSLYNRQRDRRLSAGPNQEVSRSVHWTSRVFDIPLVRWRHRFWFCVTAHGTSQHRLRKEEQTGVCHLPSAPSEYQTPL